MTIFGERDPALARVQAAAAAGWALGNAHGLEAGYRAGLAEMSDAWRAASGQKVFTASEWVDKPSAAERKAERVAILVQAHDAGLHVGRMPVNDCTKCAESVRAYDPCARLYDPLRPGEGQHGCFLADRCVGDPRCQVFETSDACQRAYVESQDAHKGDYGVTDESPPEGAHSHVPREGGKCVRCGAHGVTYAGVPWYTR